MRRRHWIAPVSALLAIAGQNLAQSRTVPTAPAEATGRAIVVSQEPTAQNPPKLVDQPPNSPSHQQSATTSSDPVTTMCNGTSSKQALFDTHTGPPDSTWIRASYLYWHLQDLPIPQILAASAPANGTTLIGAGTVDYGWFNGGKIEGGFWFGCDHVFGVEFGGFLLQERNRDFSAVSNGSDPIFRPGTDITNNATDLVFQVAGPVAGSPIVLNGRVDVRSSTRLSSGEASFVRNLAYDPCFQFDTFAGFRYLDLEDELLISSASNTTDPTVGFFRLNQSGPVFNSLLVNDEFRTRNQLYLGQLGMRAQFYRGMWFGGIRGSVAIGPNHQEIDVSGSTVATGLNVATSTAVGGLLAVPGSPPGRTVTPPGGNIGSTKTDWFVVVPEVGLQIGAQLSRFARVHVGYNFLYINNVVRPADVIDTTINRSFVPSQDVFGSNSGPARPALRNNRDDFIAHGIEAGVQFTF